MARLEHPPENLTDGVIRLRPWQATDAVTSTAALQDPEIPRWTRIPAPYTIAHAEAFIAGLAPNASPETSLSLAAVDPTTDALLGSVGLVRVDLEQHVAEIGYWVSREARRRGVATRAVRLLSAYALGALGFARLNLLTDVRNTASQGVAEKAGFTREGVLRAWMEQKGERPDYVMFSLLPADLGLDPPSPAGAQ